MLYVFVRSCAIRCKRKLCLGRRHFLPNLGPPDLPRRPCSSSLRLHLGLLPPPSPLPSPWLLPPSAPLWAAVMAMAWVPPGSSCSSSLLSSPSFIASLVSVCPLPPPRWYSYGAGRAFWEGGVMSRPRTVFVVFFLPMCSVTPFLPLSDCVHVIQVCLVIKLVTPCIWVKVCAVCLCQCLYRPLCPRPQCGLPWVF